MRISGLFTGVILMAHGCTLTQDLGGGGGASTASTGAGAGTTGAGTTGAGTAGAGGGTTGAAGSGSGGGLSCANPGSAGAPPVVVPSLLCAATTVTAPAQGSSDVTGTALDRYVRQDGSSVMAPRDLSTIDVAALVLTGGQWLAYSGTGHADGTFVIPGVPEGPYWLGIHQGTRSPIYLHTSARVVDLGRTYIGRPDRVQAAAFSTSLESVILNVGPVDAGGTISMSALAPGVGSMCLPAQPSPLGSSVHWAPTDFGPFLVDAGKGDVLYFLRQSTFFGSPGYTALSRVAAVAGVTQVDGITTPVSGSFTQVPATTGLSLDIRGSQFEAMAPVLRIPGSVGQANVDVSTWPGAAADAATLSDPIVISPRPEPPVATLLAFEAAAGDQQTGPLWYGNPFPPSWGESFGYSSWTPVSVPVPGGCPFDYIARIVVRFPAAKATAGPIVPLLGPVQDPRVNGASAYDPLTGVGTTPTLSWTAPAVGAASGHEIAVVPLIVQGSVTAVGVKSYLYTTDTSVTLPPCLLAEGTAHAFRIASIATGVDLSAHPLQGTADYARTELFTAAILP